MPGLWQCESGSSELSPTIPAGLLQELIDAMRAALPDEGCGLLIARSSWVEGGLPTRFVTVPNAAESPYRYRIDPDEQLKLWL